MNTDLKKYISEKTKEEVNLDVRQGCRVLQNFLEIYNKDLFRGHRIAKSKRCSNTYIEFLERSYREVKKLNNAGIPMRYLMSFPDILNTFFQAKTVRDVRAFKTRSVLRDLKNETDI